MVATVIADINVVDKQNNKLSVLEQNQSVTMTFRVPVNEPWAGEWHLTLHLSLKFEPRQTAMCICIMYKFPNSQ